MPKHVFYMALQIRSASPQTDSVFRLTMVFMFRFMVK
jgi:hypothetical protein